MNKYSEIAERLANRFYTADNGNVCFRDDNEDDHATLLNMTFSASQAGISRNYSYSMVRDVLQLIADTEPDDLNDVDVSSLVDVYNADLMRFVADDLNWLFADAVKEEYGDFPGDFMDIVGAAQDFAYRAALQAIISEWPNDDDDGPTLPDGEPIICDECGERVTTWEYVLTPTFCGHIECAPDGEAEREAANG